MQKFISMTLPLALSHVIGGAMLAFARAFGEWCHHRLRL
jgi:ABC-type molybdate transport system permease subunit